MSNLFRYRLIFALTAFIMIVLSSAGLAQDFVISDGDLLKITVYDNPDLTTRTLVSSKGIITFPLTGDVKVAGLRIHDAEKRIAKLLSKGYINDPQVTILITETKNVVYVTGEVQKPGKYEAGPNMTVIKAIAEAGGLTDKAAPGRTKITRETGGKESTFSAQMNDSIQPGDVINVPESFF